VYYVVNKDEYKFIETFTHILRFSSLSLGVLSFLIVCYSFIATITVNSDNDIFKLLRISFRIPYSVHH